MLHNQVSAVQYTKLLKYNKKFLCLLRTFYAASSEGAYSFSYEAVLWL